jgi:hypothetical protein
VGVAVPLTVPVVSQPAEVWALALPVEPTEKTNASSKAASMVITRVCLNIALTSSYEYSMQTKLIVQVSAAT